MTILRAPSSTCQMFGDKLPLLFYILLLFRFLNAYINQRVIFIVIDVILAYGLSLFWLTGYINNRIK